MSDKINPDHYKNNSIETCDATFSQLSEAEILGACKFNIAKYTFRAGKKVQTLEGTRDDIGKAHWYCERLLQELTNMINKRKKTKRKDPTEIDLDDLTEDDLQELLDPTYKRKSKIVDFKKKEDQNGNTDTK